MAVGWNEQKALRLGLAALGCSEGKTQNSVAAGNIIGLKIFQPPAAKRLPMFAAAFAQAGVGGLYEIAKISAYSCHLFLFFIAILPFPAQAQAKVIALSPRFSINYQ